MQVTISFYDDIDISRKERTFKKYAETYDVEIINNKSLSDSLSVSKNSIKNLFDELLREKRVFKYVLSTKTILKKRINVLMIMNIDILQFTLIH